MKIKQFKKVQILEINFSPFLEKQASELSLNCNKFIGTAPDSLFL
ncbi:hypothetical protein T4D_8463 [Trichinella pseudospiralis]|uniref:Uncharacterized protein n=1 Tax=Trichinella pseudospiralis TaxID=6337 RepID=A0A0V1E7V6_TRIPS|nr:hypothetical protein T4D_8463 [Trichinella pseudospiralis]